MYDSLYVNVLNLPLFSTDKNWKTFNRGFFLRSNRHVSPPHADRVKFKFPKNAFKLCTIRTAKVRSFVSFGLSQPKTVRKTA